MAKSKPKRFFDHSAGELLFPSGWYTLSLEHFATTKYIKKKILWEIILERKYD